jgi:hypothetical protein
MSSLLPDSIERLLHEWLYEFYRRDAMDLLPPPPAHRVAMQLLREDIRMNPPTYIFQILTVHRAHLQLQMHLPDCNPQQVHTGLRVPVSHIVSWHRCARACASRPLRVLCATDAPK